MIMAKHIHLLVFDNVSGVRAQMSDALCSLSTTASFAVRKHYENDSLQFFTECRPFILNGITGIANRPDLLERAISLKLSTMPKEKRKTEKRILKQFEELRPRLLGKLFEIISCAMRNFESTEPPTTVRMADAAQWIAAAEPATGLPAGTLLQALEDSQTETMIDRMAENPIAVALYNRVEKGVYHGRVGKLYEELKCGDDLRPNHELPKTSMHFSRDLDRLRPALEKAGIIVEFGKKGKDGRYITVRLPEHTDEDVQKAKEVHERMRKAKDRLG